MLFDNITFNSNFHHLLKKKDIKKGGSDLQLNLNIEPIDNDNDASYIFVEDSIEKKQTARRSIITKLDRLPTLKEIKQKSGRVTMSNLYDNIMDYNGYKSLPKEQQTQALLVYLNKFEIKEIASTWNKPKQTVYDAKYRLGIVTDNKGVSMLKPKPSLQEVVTLAEQRTKSKPIDKFKTKSIKTPDKEEIKDITPKKEKAKYISYHHIPNKILTGENISEFLFKLIDLFDKENKIYINMSLVKVSLSNFTFKVEVDDEFEVDSFRNDILEVIAVIPKSQVFALTAEIKEIEGLVLGQDSKDKKEDKPAVEPEVKTDKHIDIINDVTEKLSNN